MLYSYRNDHRSHIAPRPGNAKARAFICMDDRLIDQPHPEMPPLEYVIQYPSGPDGISQDLHTSTLAINPRITVEIGSMPKLTKFYTGIMRSALDIEGFMHYNCAAQLLAMFALTTISESYLDHRIRSSVESMLAGSVKDSDYQRVAGAQARMIPAIPVDPHETIAYYQAQQDEDSPPLPYNRLLDEPHLADTLIANHHAGTYYGLEDAKKAGKQSYHIHFEEARRVAHDMRPWLATEINPDHVAIAGALRVAVLLDELKTPDGVTPRILAATPQ